MKIMKKAIVCILFCMLLIIPVLSISCEAKKIVLISGQGCNGYTGGNINDNRPGNFFPFWNFIKSNQSGNYVSFNYKANPVFLIVNGIPRVIKQPASIKLGLTEPNTFACVKIFITNLELDMGTRVFSICDSIEVELL
jgi:hypothetical protein